MYFFFIGSRSSQVTPWTSGSTRRSTIKGHDTVHFVWLKIGLFLLQVVLKVSCNSVEVSLSTGGDLSSSAFR